MDTKKKNISLRVSPQDLERIGQISERMSVKDSDLIRLAIKQLLNNLALLQEKAYLGTDLLPTLIEMGPCLSGFFELSGSELDRIVNGDLIDQSRRIDIEDLRLIALYSANEEYAKARMEQSSSLLNEGEQSGMDLRTYLQNKYLGVSRVRPDSGAQNRIKREGFWQERAMTEAV